jgi:hypothetical protein
MQMNKDIWHFPRGDLAERILGMFDTGLSNALIFFAPRRMGKTEFLRKDIMPIAEKNNWLVFYFSFLDTEENAGREFIAALTQLGQESEEGALPKVTKLSGKALGIEGSVEFGDKNKKDQLDIKTLFARLSKKHKILLLMDEVQSLANNTSHAKANAQFIAGLRTGLDMYKDHVKVIFTGSSQEGLRRMFSQSKAPFFHFGQNLPFPSFDRQFTDHLVQVFKQATQRALDKEALWEMFSGDLQYTPQLARSLVERLVLNPGLSLEEAKSGLLTEIYSGRAFVETWEKCPVLERMLLSYISRDGTLLFSEKIREEIAEKLGVAALSIPTMQSTLRVLQRKNLIGQSAGRGEGYFIDDPNFKNWIIEHLT